jgi:membrane associated rhomboid family serine protease
MITASVGFQCPECARAGAKQSRTIPARSMYRRARNPVITYFLVGLIVAVFFIVSVLNGRAGFDGSTGSFYERFVTFVPYVGGRGEWYRLITGGFMHAGLIHLALNMWALWVVGPPVERLLGRSRFLLVYAASLLGGALGVTLVSSADPTVGASGAIFGIFGVLAVFEYSQGVNPLRSAVGTTIILNLVLTFTIPHISIGGHLGGLVVGSACAGILLLGRPIRARSHAEHVGRMAAVGAVGLACFGAALAIAKARYGIG